MEPEALKLLYYCALLPTKNIPREFLEKLFDSDPIKLNRYLRVLDILVLPDTGVISIYDLFQEIISDQIQTKKELLSDLGRRSAGFENFLTGHPNKAIHIFQQSLKDNLQKANSDEKEIAKILYFLGRAYYSLKDYQSSLLHLKRALEIREKDLKEQHDIASIYFLLD